MASPYAGVYDGTYVRRIDSKPRMESEMTQYFAVVQSGDRNVTPILTSADGGRFVYLFCHELLAKRFGEDQSEVPDWEIVEITKDELSQWLEARRDLDSANHVSTELAEGLSPTTQTIEEYLLYRKSLSAFGM